jgi:hypothetical protein
MEMFGYMFGMMGFSFALIVQSQLTKLIKELKERKVLPDDYK